MEARKRQSNRQAYERCQRLSIDIFISPSMTKNNKEIKTTTVVMRNKFMKKKSE